MKRLILLPVFFLILVLACKTTPESIEEGLTPAEFFQRAQTAVVERNDYKSALVYYRTFLERYPEDLPNVVAAEYEIAFIYYKLGDYDTAETLFRKLLERYSVDQDTALPSWPQILTEKFLLTLEEKKQ